MFIDFNQYWKIISLHSNDANFKPIEKFGFLMQLHNLNVSEIAERANVLINYYSDDLDDNWIIECQLIYNLGAYLQSMNILKLSAIDLCTLFAKMIIKIFIQTCI